MTRRFQFSLRTLLVAMLLLAVWLAVTTNRVRDQRRAVAALMDLGWSVQYDWERRSTSEPHGPKWLRRIIGDDYFQKVVHVYFWDGRELDEARTTKSIPLLQSLPDLKNVVYYPTIPERSQDAISAALPGRYVGLYPVP